eukprot:scaffold2934_cov114-Skeletonema_dohrnii-CCMP3373.AAC.2
MAASSSVDGHIVSHAVAMAIHSLGLALFFEQKKRGRSRFVEDEIETPYTFDLSWIARLLCRS